MSNKFKKKEEDGLKLIPSKITETHLTEIEYINMDLRESSHRIYKKMLQLIEEGKLNGIIIPK